MSSANLTALTTQSPARLLWEYSLPAIVGMLVVSLYNIVDRMFIGHAVGPEAIAGLTITFPVMNISTAVGVLVGVGASARTSILLGNKNLRGAEIILGNTLVLTILNAAVYLTVFTIFMDAILRAFGASEVTLPYAKEFLTYFLPGLMLDAIEGKNGEMLAAWANEILDRGFLTLNMLGCHDGIPMLDLRGFLSEERIQRLIDIVVGRGGYIKNLHGAKNVYYQINATYYSALGEDDRKLLLARAIQMFMPGKPQIWYLALFAGKNDYEAMRRAGAGGHKEINRTNLSYEDCVQRLGQPVVAGQLELIRMRNSSPAFSPDARVTASCSGHLLEFKWSCGGEEAVLTANLSDCSFTAAVRDSASGEEKWRFAQA